jgi:hypothetical protein
VTQGMMNYKKTDLSANSSDFTSVDLLRIIDIADVIQNPGDYFDSRLTGSVLENFCLSVMNRSLICSNEIFI